METDTGSQSKILKRERRHLQYLDQLKSYQVKNLKKSNKWTKAK